MKNKFKVEQVLNFVSEYYGISIKEITGKIRTQEIVRSRQMFLYLSYEHTGATLELIADVVNKDHATVLYSFNKIRVQKEIYSDVRKDVDDITLALYGRFPLVPDHVNLLMVAGHNSELFT